MDESAGTQRQGAWCMATLSDKPTDLVRMLVEDRKRQEEERQEERRRYEDRLEEERRRYI